MIGVNSKLPARRLSILSAGFFLISFLILALRTGDWHGYVLAVSVPVLILIGARLLPGVFRLDDMLVGFMHFFCALGILIAYRLEPASASRQILYYGIGLLLMLLASRLVRALHAGGAAPIVLIPIALAIAALPLIPGLCVPGRPGEIMIGAFSFLPFWPALMASVLACAPLMKRRRTLVWLIFALLMAAVLALGQDYTGALIFLTVVLCLFWASYGKFPLFLLGLALICGLAAAAYRFSPALQEMLRVWREPATAMTPLGNQVVQGLIAVSTGGLFGTGLGLGDPALIPGYMDASVFAVLLEQFGIIFGLCVLLLYAGLIWRCTTAAVSAGRCVHGLIASGCVAILGIQILLSVGGVLCVIPFTGVSLPFISNNGTCIIMSMFALGLIHGVHALYREDITEFSHISLFGGAQ